MSGDEVVATIASAGIAGYLWVCWCWRVLGPSSLFGPKAGRADILVAPVVANGLVLAVLLAFSASDVRTDPRYLVMYALMGAAWTGLATRVFPAMGLDAATDVAQRRNRASGLLFSGAIGGVAACYAGGNIGDGPGWWVVVFSSGLATLSFFVVWFGLNWLNRATEAVAVGRDSATALRVGGLLLACGLVFGRGVAGDWHGGPAAVTDFSRAAGPFLIVVLVEGVLGRWLRPCRECPVPSALACGLLPGAAYLGAAAAYIAWLGSWK